MRIDLKVNQSGGNVEIYGISNKKSLKKRGFGEERGDVIKLHPVEVAYLAFKGAKVYFNKKEVSNFEVLKLCFYKENNINTFFVYRDLRERGYRIKVSENLLYGKSVFLPVSERDNVKFSEIYKTACKFQRFIVAVVDEEGEVTYYEVSVPELKGEQKDEINIKSKAIFANNVIVIDSPEIFEKFFYGGLKCGTVTLSLIEGLYLAEMGVIKLDVPIEELKKRCVKVDKDFKIKYTFYKDLKNRGFVVKTGFKFGSDFRIYEKVESVKDLPHSKYLVKVAEKMKASEMASHIRVANTVRKKMVFGFLDDGIKYICLQRIKV